MRRPSGSHSWFAWALAWTALMVVILLIGTVEWRDSIFWFPVPVFGSIFGNRLIGYRARRGFWPWSLWWRRGRLHGFWPWSLWWRRRRMERLHR